MKLDMATIAYIESVVKTAKAIGIDRLVIEPGFARGVDEEHSRALIHTTDVPVMPFGSIGINRLDIFTTRLEMAKSVSGFGVEVTTQGEDPLVVVDKDTPKGMFASALHFKSKGLKLDFKCSNPMILKSPRNLKDKMRYRLQMTPETVSFLSKGKSAFGTDEVTLIVNNDSEVSIELVDINNDRMSYQIASTVDREIEGDKAPISYSKSFSLSMMLSLFKLNPDCYFYVSERVGYIKMQVNSLDVNILPRK